MLILLRGHVRNSFESTDLYEFVRAICKNDTQIIVHTWDVRSNSLSWRSIDADNTPVTEAHVRLYFQGFHLPTCASKATRECACMGQSKER